MGSVAFLPMVSTSPSKNHHEDINMKDADGDFDMASGKEFNLEGTTASQNPQHDMTTNSSTLQSPDGKRSNSDSIMKKKKLTAAEKAEAQALKDIETQKKAEEKSRKEDARLQKEEEKRIKQEEAKKERDEKQKIKDAAKAEKDAEKKAKEEAQAKKQKVGSNRCDPSSVLIVSKAQSRLGAFFKAPATDAEVVRNNSRRSSIGSIDVDADQDVSVASGLAQQRTSEYDKAFPSFFLHTHTTLAPIDPHPIDEARRQWAIDQIENGKNKPSHRPDTVLGKRKRASYLPQPSVKRILLKMQGNASTNPIELDVSSSDAPSKILETVPIKYIKFKEDVRPPWIGTYSKAPEGHKFAALCRNPFRRGLPHVNYDYDSEAEWEEPEEGEDLNSEGEEDDDDDDEDMEEFLDDEAAESLPRRKQLVGDLEPVYTGLNWENSSRNNTTVQFGATNLDLEHFRIGILFGKSDAVSQHGHKLT